jgi:nucleoside-diphosphate-sugar epimerase
MAKNVGPSKIKKAASKSTSIAKTPAKKILITGGTGFLGTHIVRQFLDAGEKNLRVMATSVPAWMKDSGVEPVEVLLRRLKTSRVPSGEFR